jgi:cytidylate kinase
MNFRSIAMSGLPGSGKSSLAKKLAEKLRWKTYSIGEMFRNEHKIWSEINPEVSFEEWWAKYVSDETIYEVNDKAKIDLQLGRVIIDTRYAPVNVSGVKNSFKLFITCPIEIRAERNKSKKIYKGKSLAEIKAHLSEREKEELRRGQELYGGLFCGNFDYRSPEHYSLILDSSISTIEKEVELVLKKLRGRQ